ncbi:MAG: T9SS type A sorting domain-containing protein [Bacteroidetes bacterium]|nr:T9SS type A sorting domain-containing protein [Bacteroidota bacterium]
MKKSFTILALLIVNLVLFNGLLKAGVESNNLIITGKVLYKNTTTPVQNAVVKLYLVNSDEVTYKVLESVTVNDKGEYMFNSAQIGSGDKVRIGAYVNDIIQNDRIIINTNQNNTDEIVELGAYANDIIMDRINPLSEIYGSTILVDLNAAAANSKFNLYLNGNVIESTNDFMDGGGIGTYPREPILNQNYPNPFNPTTNIKYGIPQQAFVTLKVYDMSGKLVADLVNEIKEQGYYTIKFDGSKLASGFYLYRLTAGDYTTIKKMSLIK